MYSEPDEGTIMIWIDELSNELIKRINEILFSQDELEDSEEENFKYFTDTTCEKYYKIKQFLTENNYLITGW